MRLISLIFLIIIALTPLGELGRIPFVLEKSYIYPNDILIPLLLLVWVTYRLAVSKNLQVPLLIKPMALVLVVSAFSLLVAKANLSTPQFIVSALYLVRLTEYLALYWVAWDLVRRSGEVGSWVKVLLGVSLSMALTGFIQLVIVPDFGFAAQYGWDPHVGRLLGTFFDPNFIGGFLSLGLALALGLLTSHKTTHRGWLMSLSLVLFVAIVLTFSRSGYLALGAVVVVMGWLRARWLIGLGLIGFAVALLLIPRIGERLTEGVDPGESASFRFSSWSNAITVWQSSPLIGIGYNTYRYSQDRLGLAELTQSGNAGAGADSSLLFILATTGVVGLTVWLYLLWRVWLVGWHNLKRGGVLGAVLLASLVALIIHSQFVNSLFFIWMMLWLWVLVGLSEGEKVV